MDHVGPCEVDESFADLQAEQHQSNVGQLILVLCQVVPELQMQTVHSNTQRLSRFFFFRELDTGSVAHSHGKGDVKLDTNLSVLIKLHDDPHGIVLDDSDEFDNVLMVEVLHDYWQVNAKVFVIVVKRNTLKMWFVFKLPASLMNFSITSGEQSLQVFTATLIRSPLCLKKNHHHFLILMQEMNIFNFGTMF